MSSVVRADRWSRRTGTRTRTSRIDAGGITAPTVPPDSADPSAPVADAGRSVSPTCSTTPFG